MKRKRYSGEQIVYALRQVEAGSAVVEICRKRKKLARRSRVPVDPAGARNECWSMDFRVDRLADGRRFQILTVIDHTRGNVLFW